MFAALSFSQDDKQLVREYAENPEIKEGLWRMHNAGLINYTRQAIRWIRKYASDYKVDHQKLGAIGYSAGGHLVCLLATTGEAPGEMNGNIDTRIQAAVAGEAPTDFRNLADDGKWAEYWMGGDLKTVPQKFHAASAAADADQNDPPVFFFFNGTAD